MKLKSLYQKTKGCCKRFILLNVTLLFIGLVPILALFRKRPFHNYVFVVALQWFKLISLLLNACGAKVQVVD